jgi:UDP-N-acetyl-D-galactosamine dehydrogenase
LEKDSGLKFGKDFKVGYSPERVNPGDKVHTIDKIFKIVSASDAASLEKIAEVYGSITKIHKASNIKVAEAAKVIENVQRDLNIALMNELALIFDRLGINTKEVIEAAGTKWNFHKYYPGLVGGHCIGIDPYYLTYKAQKMGYEPKVILAGRGINEFMAEFVASKLKNKKKILILGLTFKENVPDIRNSKAKDLIMCLRDQGSLIFGHDPILKSFDGIAEKFGLTLINNFPPEEKFDAIVVFSPHLVFQQPNYALSALIKICEAGPVLFDLKGFYNMEEAESLGFKYLTL